MSHFLFPSALRLSALVLLALAWTSTSARADRANFTGVVLINQGFAHAVGSVNGSVTVQGGKRTYLFKGTVNGAEFTQKIVESSGKRGKVTVSNLVPGISGFGQSAKGSFKVSGSTQTIKAPLPSPYQGTFQMRIEKITFGQTISFSSLLSFTGGSIVPISVTMIVGATGVSQ